MDTVLQHVGDALLGSEIALLTHERYPRLVVGVRSVRSLPLLLPSSSLSRTTPFLPCSSLDLL